MIGTTLGHYRIVEKIGEGGMGEVYRAHDERPDRDVAIKVLTERVADDWRRLARLEREAKLFASLNHQNVAILHGLEEQEGQRVVAIELAEGETLTDRIKKGQMGISMCYRQIGRWARVLLVAIGCAVPLIAFGQEGSRARDLDIPFAGTPGPLNAITDVAGVTVGHTTLISGDGQLHVGSGPVRTGVTAVHPRGKTYDPVFAGWYALNGNGEMTGTTWVEESGFLEGPVVITNTHSVGVARDAVIEWQFANKLFDPLPDEPDVFWSLPVVAETYDGDLNDINGFHVTKKHVIDALESAKSGPVDEGNVGGGTGMICHQFKGGIGTASRRQKIADREYTVGILVQANYGSRSTLTIAGVPLGDELTDLMPVFRTIDESTGSIIVVVATDAPLLPHQLERLARRVPIGISKVGGYASNGSGDIFIAFSTANPGVAAREGMMNVEMLPNDAMSPLFLATAQATEEAIVNALVAAKTMVGINGNTVYALPHDRLIGILREHKRIAE